MIHYDPKSKTNEKNIHRLFSQIQIDLIESMHIPRVVRFMLADRFDSKFIDSSYNVWSFNYSGKKEYIDFNKKSFLDGYEIKLLKFFLIHYSQINTPSSLSRYFNIVFFVFMELVNNKKTLNYSNLETILLRLANTVNRHVDYYILKRLIRLLIAEEFEGFTEEDELKLELLERPAGFNSQLLYQEAEDAVSCSTITMIQNGFTKLNAQITKGEAIADDEIKNASILGLVYVAGMRPVQLSKLAVQDIKVDTYSDMGAMRYSILVPYAKQGRFNHAKVPIKLPEEITVVVLQYIKQFQLTEEQQLFDLGGHAVAYCNKAINKQLFELSSEEYKRKVISGDLIQIKFTTSQFRHHVAYSMALSGASAEDISYVLGHSSLVTARHYIYSSPNLAQIRAMALGRNPVYRRMIAMLMTGDIIKQEEDMGKNIVGLISGTLHNYVGRCTYEETCFLEPVRSCYGCIYFRPYLDGKHHKVLDCIQKELESIVHISDAVYNSCNPIINLHEATKFEIVSVIKRCELNREIENVY